jgi:hypothetical protein
MIIGSKQRLANIINDPQIELGEATIKRVNKSKTLGVVIDDHLTWNTQIDNITKKVIRATFRLQFSRKIFLVY